MGLHSDVEPILANIDTIYQRSDYCPLLCRIEFVPDGVELLEGVRLPATAHI